MHWFMASSPFQMFPRCDCDIGGDREGKEGGDDMALQPGRVILAVPDMSMVEFFREQVSRLSNGSLFCFSAATLWLPRHLCHFLACI